MVCVCVGYEPAADPGARVWSQPGTTPLIHMELHHEPILQGIIHVHSYIHTVNIRKLYIIVLIVNGAYMKCPFI